MVREDLVVEKWKKGVGIHEIWEKTGGGEGASSSIWTDRYMCGGGVVEEENQKNKIYDIVLLKYTSLDAKIKQNFFSFY